MTVNQVKNPKTKPIATGKTNPPNKTKVDVNVKMLTISLFFDGTGNNRFNSAANRKGDEFKRSYDREISSVSYRNYYSNIALLYFSLKEKPGQHEKIYIEGAGTFQHKADEDYGLGLAQGYSGIEWRVMAAIDQVRKLVNKHDSRKARLNVYGFRRGAAYARYFCWKIKQSDIGAYYINFVGLFDTVSSAGVEHYNDVEQFHLDIGKPEQIHKIVHFTAQNDYRFHFPLTSIKTAATMDEIGFECSFPGAHSDIGGGYYEPWKETEKKLSHKNMALMSANHIYYKWYLEKGYFTEAQIKVKGFYPQEYVVGSRDVKIDYQFIPGGIMMELMKIKADYEERKNSIMELQISAMKSIPVLKKFYDKASEYVLKNYEKSGLKFQVPLLSGAEMKQIYNKFIHISLDADGGKIINPANTGTPKSKAKTATGNLDPMKPVRPKVTKGYRS